MMVFIKVSANQEFTFELCEEFFEYPQLLQFHVEQALVVKCPLHGPPSRETRTDATRPVEDKDLTHLCVI
jgi:hypothetical protein